MKKEAKEERDESTAPRSANPTATPRDELTGKYVVDKKTATKLWFEEARNLSAKPSSKQICPKQAIYVRKRKKLD